MKKKAFVFSLLFFTVVSFASAEIYFEEVNRFPERPSIGSQGVITAQLVQTVGQRPVVPIQESCDPVSYRIKDDQGNIVEEEMEYVDGSNGYFYGEVLWEEDIREITLVGNTEGCEANTGDVSYDLIGFPEGLGYVMTRNLEEHFSLDDSDDETLISDYGSTTTAHGIRNIEDGAREFDGSDDYIEIQETALNLDYGSSGSYQELGLSLWFHPEEISEGVIYSDTGMDDGLLYGYDVHVSDKLSLRVFDGYNASDGFGDHVDGFLDLDVGTVDGDKWNHGYIGFREGTNHIDMFGYLNGENNTLDSRDVNSGVTFATNEENAFIGSNPVLKEGIQEFDEDFDGSDIDFKGYIDDVRFYSENIGFQNAEEITDKGFSYFYSSEITAYNGSFHEKDEDLEAELGGYMESEASHIFTDDSLDPQWEHLDYTGESIGSGTTFEVPEGNTTLYIAEFSDDYHQNNIFGHAGREGSAVPIEVERSLEGDLSLSNEDGKCNENVTVCEKGAEILVTVEETINTAESVEGRILLEDGYKSFEEFERANNSFWESNFRVPKGFEQENLEIEVEMEEEKSNAVLEEEIEINSYDVFVETDYSERSPGRDITFQLKPRTPFSSEIYPVSNISEFNIQLDRLDEIEEMSVEDVGNYTDEMEGRIDYTYNIPVEMDDGSTVESGEVIIEAELFDISGFENSGEGSFDILDYDASGSDIRVHDITSPLGYLSDNSITNTLDRPRKIDGTVYYANYGDLSADFSISFEGDLEGIGEVEESSYTLGNKRPDKERRLHDGVSIELDFSSEEPGIYEGEIVAEVSGHDEYDVVLDVEYEVKPECAHELDGLCIVDEVLAENITSPDQEVLLEVENQLDDPLDTGYSFDTFSDISDVLEDKPDISLGVGERTHIEIPLNDELTADNNGFYDEPIVFEVNNSELEVPTELDVNIPEGSISISLGEPSEDEVFAGDTVEIDFDIENTGDTSFDYVDITTDPSGGSKTIDTLSVGESYSGELEVDTSGFSEGETTVDVEAVSNTSASDTDSFSLSIAQDIEDELEEYSDRIDELEEEIMDFDTDVDTSEMFQLSESILSDISDAKELWDDEEYEEAIEIYEGIDFTELESLIDEAQTDDGQEGTDDEPPVNGETGDENGGVSMVLIIFPIMLLLVFGTVIYLSIVPEEGGRN